MNAEPDGPTAPADPTEPGVANGDGAPPPKKRRWVLVLCCVLSVVLVVAASAYWKTETNRADRADVREARALRARDAAQRQADADTAELSALTAKVAGLRRSLRIDDKLDAIDQANREALADVRVTYQLLQQLSDALAREDFVRYNAVVAQLSPVIDAMNTATAALGELARELELRLSCATCQGN